MSASMGIETAEWLHRELRENLPGPSGDARDALDEVVKLHAPVVEHFTSGTFVRCDQCFNDNLADNWPCRTIVEINAYAHVDFSDRA